MSGKYSALAKKRNGAAAGRDLAARKSFVNPIPEHSSGSSTKAAAEKLPDGQDPNQPLAGVGKSSYEEEGKLKKLKFFVNWNERRCVAAWCVAALSVLLFFCDIWSAVYTVLHMDGLYHGFGMDGKFHLWLFVEKYSPHGGLQLFLWGAALLASVVHFDSKRKKLFIRNASLAEVFRYVSNQRAFRVFVHAVLVITCVDIIMWTCNCYLVNIGEHRMRESLLLERAEKANGMTADERRIANNTKGLFGHRLAWRLHRYMVDHGRVPKDFEDPEFCQNFGNDRCFAHGYDWHIVKDGTAVWLVSPGLDGRFETDDDMSCKVWPEVSEVYGPR